MKCECRSEWTCIFVTKNWNMANFDMFDKDYRELFITQQSKDYAPVSLEEDGDICGNFRTVNDPQYSDISNSEEKLEDEACDHRLR